MLNGRYGPYITDKKRNAKIPKDRDPKSLTLAECQSTAGRRSGAHFWQVGPEGKRVKAAAPRSGKARRKAPRASGAGR